MKNKLIAFVRPFDIFGLVPLMTFARAPKVYSRLSMFLSVFTLSVLIFIILYLGISVVQRKKPSFFQFSLPSTSITERLMFGADTFPIKVSRNLGTLVNGQDFFFDGYAQTEYPANRFEFDEYTCADDWSLMCFPQSQDVGKSYIGNVGYDSFEIDLYTCATPGSGCATSSDIDTQISSSSFLFYYNDQVVDPYDYDEPIKIRPMQNSEPLQKDVYKIVIIYLEETEFRTDNGWIFESLTTQTALSVNRIQTYTADRTSDYRASLVIKYTGNKNVYKRTYPKIQDLLAQISGIVAVMIPVVALLAFPYAQFKMKEYMVNELYEVKLPKKNDGGSSPGKGKNKTKTTKGSEKVNKKPAAINSVLPEKFGTGNKEQGSPQKRLINDTKEKINECPSPPYFESFENPKTGNENEVIIEKSTGISRRSKMMVSPVELQKTSFENSQTKFNKLKKPEKSQLELISFEEGMPQRDEDGFLNKEAVDEPEKVEEVEEENCEEAIEVRGAPVFLNEARHSDKLNLTFRQFLKSYFRPQPEIEIIKKVESDLTDAMDLASLAKKSSDLDKLKAILFTPEERAIFDNLPISVVAVGMEQQVTSKAKIVVNHYKWENSLRGNVGKVNEAYTKLRDVDKKSELQKRLLGFYESQYLEDFLAHAYQES